MTQIEVRAASVSEYPHLRALFAAAFKSDDEACLWDYLVAHHPALQPEGIRVAVKDGEPVACTVALPGRMRTPRGWVGGAVVTLVACHPDCQGQGYGGATVRDALQWIGRQGLSVAVLYGHPTYYPRFGFVPVLPRFESVLTALPGGEAAPSLLPAGADDFTALTDLYDQQAAIYPCATARPAEAWAWGLRNPDAHQLLLLPGRQGYAYVTPSQKAEALIVHEGAALGAGAALELLTGLSAVARQAGLPRLKLLMPFDHPLARTARALGAEQHNYAAAAGMAAVTRWQYLVPRGYTVTDEGLSYAGRPILRAGRAALTQLVLGYRSAAELCLLPDSTLLDPADATQLERDFPAGQPKWWLEPFWD